MMQVCKEAGMTYQTLKFYCNEGLIPNVKRDQNNRRIFDDHNVAWIKSLGCLKNCGMSIQDMKTYLELCLKGPATIPERKQILSEKRLELLGKLTNSTPRLATLIRSRHSMTACFPEKSHISAT